MAASPVFDHVDWPPGAEGRPVVIGIAGGSGSGKSTIVEAIGDATGGQVGLMEHDAYYRDNAHLDFEQRAAINYDHPDSLESELLVEHLAALRSGMSVDKPVYDFSTHLRTGETARVTPAPVVIVEGILVLVEPDLRRMMDLKIFIDTDPDIRLLRRLQRDIEERGRDLESIIAQYEGTVRPMHLQFVEPSKRYADIIIPEGYNPPAVATVVSMIDRVLSRA
ncbi:MAG: uridine kinase [Acidimicrobiia bacterium]|nr:uridine kinase [Acidimicrobiia bacterium]MBT8214796.1 uridine kinase [Acidimicrobiia bacterium]NNF70140.1 uridine kinase [Acidimicrobiia bacterium]NNK91202.1 uridine kinase [Acidimicrobiia bacterium]